MEVNYKKVQFDDNSRQNNYRKEPENVNYESVINEFVTNKIEKINFKQYINFIYSIKILYLK